jgi:hypothetical protein
MCEGLALVADGRTNRQDGERPQAGFELTETP